MEILIPILAVTVIGLICAVGLAVASSVMAVKEDTRFTEIRACLPGANCGACGYTGCDGYAKALLEYSDEDVRVPPQPPASGSETTVRTEVQPKTGRPIQINYSMHLGNEGWKVYDVTVDGVSLVSNYRSTFASQIRNSGLDAVIADLQQRNAQGGR